MKRIDTTDDNLFHDPDVGTLTPGTIVPAESLNNFQEEVAHGVETLLVLDGADNHQLAKVLNHIALTGRYLAFFGGGY